MEYHSATKKEVLTRYNMDNLENFILSENRHKSPQIVYGYCIIPLKCNAQNM